MEENLKFAVFIDYDNIEIGVRTTLGRDLDIAIVLEGIKQRGEIVAKIAYGNWGHHLEATRAFSEFGVHMVQRDSTPRGDKNGADINLALDAFEMAVTRDHINAFAIISGDSDFMSLVNKLKQYNKRVYIVGGKQFTSKILQRNCHEFISYESLLDILPSRSRRGRSGRPTQQQPRTDAQPVSQIMPLVDRALNALDVRGAQPQLGLLKSTMLQLDPAFSERDYGVTSFSSLAEKLVAEGYIKVVTVDNHHVVERSADVGDSSDSSDNGDASDAGESESSAAPRTQDAEGSAGPSQERRGRSRGRGRGRGRGRSSEGRISTPRDEGEPQREARPAPVEEAPAKDPRSRLQQLLAPHIELLEMGIPAREVEALIRTDEPRFSPKKLGFEDFTALLDFAEAEELLRSIPDDRNLLRFKPGDSLTTPSEAEESPAEEEATEESSAAPRRRRRRRNASRRTADGEGDAEETSLEAADEEEEEAPVEEPSEEESAPAKKKAAKRKTAKKAAKKKSTRKKASKKAAADDSDDED